MDAEIVVLDQLEIDILEKIIRSKTLGSSFKERAQIILPAAEGHSNRKISELFQFEEHRVGIWRNRWINQHETWKQLDPNLRPPMSQKLVLQWLADQEGRGKKPTITEEQKAMILALACEPPSKSAYFSNTAEHALDGSAPCQRSCSTWYRRVHFPCLGICHAGVWSYRSVTKTRFRWALVFVSGSRPTGGGDDVAEG